MTANVEASQNLVEIIGPPGVGKTTLYLEACKKWKEGEDWIYEEALLVRRPSVLQFRKWMEYNYKKFMGKRLRKNIPIDFGLLFSEQNPELSDFLWKYLSRYYFNKRQISYRYRAVYFLFLNFSRYHAILGKTSNRPVLLEEGFLQKSFLVHEDKVFLSEMLDEYLSLIPLPSAVISMVTDDDLLLKRIKSRQKVIASHKGKNNQELLKDLQNWLLLNSLIAKKLSKKNIPVKIINGGDNLDQQINMLNSGLKEFRRKGKTKTIVS